MCFTFFFINLSNFTAIDAYNGEEYELAVERFEKALQGFYEAEIECRAMCEGEHDGGDEFLPQTTTFYRQTIGMRLRSVQNWIVGAILQIGLQWFLLHNQ